MIRLIAAVDERGGIGASGGIPWNSPDDRAHFRRLTWGSTVLMGRTTFESIGKPLAGRRNIVLSRQTDLILPGCDVYCDLAEALGQCAEVWVIGGASIYEQTIPVANELHLTEIPGDYHCDRFLPDLHGFGGSLYRYRFAALAPA